MTTDENEHTTNYTCPACGSEEWYIQNRIAPVAAYFDPEITHVECATCGHVDEASTERVEE